MEVRKKGEGGAGPRYILAWISCNQTSGLLDAGTEKNTHIDSTRTVCQLQKTRKIGTNAFSQKDRNVFRQKDRNIFSQKDRYIYAVKKTEKKSEESKIVFVCFLQLSNRIDVEAISMRPRGKMRLKY